MNPDYIKAKFEGVPYEINPRLQTGTIRIFDKDKSTTYVEADSLDTVRACVHLMNRIQNQNGQAKCVHRCPKCKFQCNKGHQHAEAGYDGIAGLCWCNQCAKWWVAATPEDAGKQCETLLGYPVRIDPTIPPQPGIRFGNDLLHPDLKKGK